MVTVAVVGAGYWGPNLARNIALSDMTQLTWICDLDLDRAARVGRHFGEAKVTNDLSEILDDRSVDGVAIATPVATHAAIAQACLKAGKHVLIEKPLAASVEEGAALVELAESQGLNLMTDHTFCYTAVVGRIRDLVRSGDIGDLLYYDSVRVNLGLVQSDIDVFWDLAPHDLSILDFVLPETVRPVSVSARGADPLGVGLDCIGHLTIALSNGALAHAHLNWLSPTKIRTTIVGGSKRMLMWDDLRPAQRLSVFDAGVEIDDFDAISRHEALVSYRIGDMVAPSLPEGEALKNVVEEFAESIAERRIPLTDGAAGLRVLEVLAAADRSRASDGQAIALDQIYPAEAR
jgi:predicted dehydrogenase